MKDFLRKITALSQTIEALIIPVWLANAQLRHLPQAQSAGIEYRVGKEEQKNSEVATYFPLYYDQLTNSPKIFPLNASNVYRLKIMKGDSVYKWATNESWPEEPPQSDSLIGLIHTALNGRKANVNNLPDNKDLLFLDMDRDGLVMGRKGARVPVEEALSIIRKNVYSEGGK